MKLVLFDGECNLCQFSVQFIIKRDPLKQFKFVSLQSEKGREELSKFNLYPKEMTTIYLIDQDKVYDRSDAALKISKHLTGFYSLFSVLIVIPKIIRDPFYKLISKFRYQIFGKTKVCLIDKDGLSDRFL